MPKAGGIMSKETIKNLAVKNLPKHYHGNCVIDLGLSKYQLCMNPSPNCENIDCRSCDQPCEGIDGICGECRNQKINKRTFKLLASGIYEKGVIAWH